MDYWFIAYIVICICLGGGAVSYMYNRDQTLGAMILLVLVIAIFAFFGLRWFKDGALKGSTASNVQWPPIVNLCPDYMVAVQGVATSGTSTPVNTYCADPSGLYSALPDTFYPLNSNAPSKGIMIKDGMSGATNPFPKKAAKTITEIVPGSGGPSVRWEGVYNGQTFSTALMPTPPK
jgi:hypothetical protein